jgi:hypothetical protein
MAALSFAYWRRTNFGFIPGRGGTRIGLLYKAPLSGLASTGRSFDVTTVKQFLPNLRPAPLNQWSLYVMSTVPSRAATGRFYSRAIPSGNQMLGDPINVWDNNTWLWSYGLAQNMHFSRPKAQDPGQGFTGTPMPQQPDVAPPFEVVLYFDLTSTNPTEVVDGFVSLPVIDEVTPAPVSGLAFPSKFGFIGRG